MPDRILRLREVTQRIALGKTTIWAMIGRGDFPAPMRLGARARGWPESEIEAWIAARRRGAFASPAIPHREPPALRDEALRELLENAKRELCAIALPGGKRKAA